MTIRSDEELNAYLKEVYERKWYFENYACKKRKPEEEEARLARLQELKNIYPDISDDYSQYLYFKGVEATLLWVLGERKEIF